MDGAQVHVLEREWSHRRESPSRCEYSMHAFSQTAYLQYMQLAARRKPGGTNDIRYTRIVVLYHIILHHFTIQYNRLQ